MLCPFLLESGQTRAPRPETAKREAAPSGETPDAKRMLCLAWAVDDVCKFSTNLELGHVVAVFRENAVDGRMLASLSEADLVDELGSDCRIPTFPSLATCPGRRRTRQQNGLCPASIATALRNAQDYFLAPDLGMRLALQLPCPPDMNPEAGQPYSSWYRLWGDPDMAPLPFLQHGVPTGTVSALPPSQQWPAKKPRPCHQI